MLLMVFSIRAVLGDGDIGADIWTLRELRPSLHWGPPFTLLPPRTKTLGKSPGNTLDKAVAQG
jgi:hypothetical protein